MPWGHAAMRAPRRNKPRHRAISTRLLQGIFSTRLRFLPRSLAHIARSIAQHLHIATHRSNHMLFSICTILHGEAFWHELCKAYAGHAATVYETGRVVMRYDAHALMLAFFSSAALLSIADRAAAEPKAPLSSAFAIDPALLAYAPPVSHASLDGPLVPSVLAKTKKVPTTKRYSTPLLVGGIVMTSIGAGATGLGLLYMLFTATAPICGSPNLSPDDWCVFENRVSAAQYLFVGASMAVTGLGVTMIVVGKRRVPIEPSVALRVSPMGLGVEGRF